MLFLRPFCFYNSQESSAWFFLCSLTLCIPLFYALFAAKGMYSRCCLMIQIDKCVARKPCCSFAGFSVAYFGALARFTIGKVKIGLKSLFSSRGCFGCFTKPQLITAVDEPSKGLKIQGLEVKKRSLSEDFWSTTTYEMENSAIQSQRSISSISTSNPNPDCHGTTGSTSNPSEFVNHGLLLWSQIRQQWVGDRKTRVKKPKTREPRLSWNASYESLLGTNKPFPQPIPLPEMVEFLVDVWEQEGMYD